MSERGGRDALYIISATALRHFGYGLISVEVALYWRAHGIPPLVIGVLFTIALLSSGAMSALAGRFSARLGRRRSLRFMSVAIVLGGAAMALSTWWPLLALVSLLATFSPTGKDVAAILPIEQAALARLGGTARRMTLYARYNMTAALAGALGALAVVALPVAVDGPRAFWLYALIGVLLFWLYSGLSPAIEEERGEGDAPAGRLLKSRRVVLRLTALFGVDALAGGLVAQGIAVLWLHERFGIAAGTAGLLFFGTNLAMALSQLAAPWLARRFGLLNTMVFTHLPSNVLLLLVAFAPSFAAAATLLVFRSLLSQLDVPTRQAYTMALVPPEERGAAAGTTAAVRGVASAVSPAITGLALAVAAFGLPFVLAGSLKAAYDLALYGVFRGVPIEQGS
jgi:MFS family permease